MAGEGAFGADDVAGGIPEVVEVLFVRLVSPVAVSISFVGVVVGLHDAVLAVGGDEDFVTLHLLYA